MESNIENVNRCIFKEYLECSINNEYCPVEMTDVRKQKVIESSVKRKDQLNVNLVEFSNIKYHKNCYLSYTSKDHIARHLKRTTPIAEGSSESKRSRRSLSTSFNFKKNCFICGESCNVIPDKKHPDRWKKNKAFVCRTADRGKGKLSFKEVLLQICNERGDAIGDNVRLRIEGACSDLHAAEARYHERCLQSFKNPKEIKSAQRDDPVKSPEEYAIRYIARSIRNSPDKSWVSTVLHDIYITNGGTETNKSRFITKITEHMKNEIYVFSSPGIASILMLKDKASSMFKLQTELNDDDDTVIRQIAQRIKSELKQLPNNNKEYTSLDKNNIFGECSKTLLNLLYSISPNFKNSLASAMIGNIVTSTANRNFTRLQLSMGILAHEKKLIEHLHNYGVTCTYHEVRRFKISAAVASENPTKQMSSSNGLIQVISDNFDAHVHSQNGLKETHSLATIITQPTIDVSLKTPIPRLKQEQLKLVKLNEPTIRFYTGQKNPPMPFSFCTSSVLPLKVLANQIVSLRNSRMTDYTFIKSITSNEGMPDYNGFNTEQARITAMPIKPKSQVTFQPLIDKVPSDPSTILTAMYEAERITNEAGQCVTIFTADQQLYRVALDIVWSEPERWRNFYPRIGGMHWLMSFIGCVGVLMENSGLTPWLKSSFAGAEKMLIGKKFPQNVRALRFVVVELLKDFIDDMSSYDELQVMLDDVSAKSILSKHWIENLIKPVFLMMLYVKAEREGNFALHLYACKLMLPYFFAAGHINYARYGLCYMLTMSRLPSVILEQFLNGEHALHHRSGLWNGIWSDMMIETTYMKFGKGPSGIIGQTTKPKTVQIWAKSQHSCGEVLKELDNILGKDIKDKVKHKEEGKGRIKSDEIDRKKLRDFFGNCIHPLNLNSHDQTILCNIYTGQTTDETVNVYDSVEIGKNQLIEFKRNLPEGFRATISKTVVTMKEGKKSKKKNIVEVYNTEIIFSRVIYLLSAGHIDIDDLFTFELSPVPTSLFKDTGEGRYPTAKSVLKNDLKIEVTTRNLHCDAVIIDGCAMLHAVIHWPKGGKVNDLVESVRKYISKKISTADVYLIFDRYIDYSIKSDTRLERLGKFSRSHNINSLCSPLPPKEISMKSNKTKLQLIKLISNDLLDYFINSSKKLVITWQNEEPEESLLGVRKKRVDLKTTQEEADVIIPQQVAETIKDGKKNVSVICEDTDVFTLLCHCYHQQSWKINLYMEGFSQGKNMISIKETVERHSDIIPSLLSMHALTGCDTVPMMFGIGKKKGIGILKKLPLQYLGAEDANPNQIIDEAKEFVANCYGCKSNSSSKNRDIIWRRRTQGAKITSKPPPLRSLPPTDEALELNIWRARFQRMVWDSCLDSKPPDLDPCTYGWQKDDETKTLHPVMLPAFTKTAPEEVLKITRCNCKVSQCKTMACLCAKAHISCSDFCGCEGTCKNKWNLGEDDLEDNSMQSTSDESSSSEEDDET